MRTEMREVPIHSYIFELQKLLEQDGGAEDYQSLLERLNGRELHNRYALRHPVPLKDKPVSLVTPLRHDRNHHNKLPQEPLTEPECLRAIVLGHVRLLEKQHLMVADKEKQIVDLKKENSALKARLERMDRRISLKKTPMIVANPSSSKKRSISERVHRSSESAEEDLEPKRKRGRVKSNSVGSDQSESSPDETKETDEKIVEWAEHSQGTEIPVTHVEVEVPSWRLNPLTDVFSMEKTEHLSDSTFEKRHQKCEMEERRIKKWDAQRIREEERRRQMLANNRFSITNFSAWAARNNPEESGRNSAASATMFDLKQIEQLEVTTAVPRVMPSKSSAPSTTKSHSIQRRKKE